MDNLPKELQTVTLLCRFRAIRATEAV